MIDLAYLRQLATAIDLENTPEVERCLTDAAAEIERLRAALTTTRDFIEDQLIAHALVPKGGGGPETWPALHQVIDEALGVCEQKEDGK